MLAVAAARARGGSRECDDDAGQDDVEETAEKVRCDGVVEAMPGAGKDEFWNQAGDTQDGEGLKAPSG